MQPKTTAVALLAAVLTVGTARAGLAEQLTYQCVDSTNGTQWTLRVDTGRHTVNDMPAEISASHVAWVDKPPVLQNSTSDNGGKATESDINPPNPKKNDLNRASGTLVVRSAGAQPVFHRCKQASSAG